MTAQEQTSREGKKPYVVLVLQGGGALGAYHVGAYQAMQEAGYEPDWVSGISIGAVNAALIAGNTSVCRLDKLNRFWKQEISRNDGWGEILTGQVRRWFNTMSVGEAVLFGLPNFFLPRIPNPFFCPPWIDGGTSVYDTNPLRDTLERLVDFELINARHIRLSLGATRVVTGELVFFDNTSDRIGPEHVLASGALPPGFPAAKVNDDLYWDGGCVSNTPLETILDHENELGEHTLVFMIDLWNAKGTAPRSMDEVLWRQKQIQYASRTAHNIKTVTERHNLRWALGAFAKAAESQNLERQPELREAFALLSKNGMPPEARPGRGIPTASEVRIEEYGKRMDIVHLIYEPSEDQIPQSDAEFSQPSIESRRLAGYADMKQALAEACWRKTKQVGLPAVVHTIQTGPTSVANSSGFPR